MNRTLLKLKAEILTPCGLTISNFKAESESQDYDACRFDVNKQKIISRTAKVTPKKSGQFVTVWKRNEAHVTEPFSEHDAFDLLTITVVKDDTWGQFVFPKAVLITQGILSSAGKPGKRGFRVYPIWDKVSNKQAEKTQKWQLEYFYQIDKATEFERVLTLYHQTN